MFSVVTSTSLSPLPGLSVSLTGCCLSDLQEAVRLVIPKVLSGS